ncbi:MAG: FAD-binding oxidoreductase [Oscillospiraceae bacterium]|jgi:glycolate oxidase|nr:FAD-binding oxidoreductase [Oscillospiraceae bacterium]
MATRRATQADAIALSAELNGAKVLFGTDISDDYAHDEMSGVFSAPDVLVRVKSTEDVCAVMRYASREGVAVVVRGSGTGLVGGAVAVDGGIMLETTAMNRILELDEKNMCVTVQSGVLLTDLVEFCESRGFFYPPDPGEKTATIGGNIATNAGGMRAVKYGVTRDYVLGLEIVLPGGEVLNTGGKVVKNSSGDSLQDIIIGSEGTLAVVTKAILKLLPAPAVSMSMLAPFASIDSAIEAVPVLLNGGFAFTSLEFMERETINFAEEYLSKKFLDTKHPAYLLLTIDGGGEDMVLSACSEATEACLAAGAQDIFLVDTADRKKAVWDARSSFLEAIKASAGEIDECDVVVPRAEVAAFVKYTHELAQQVGLRLPGFGHAGDGNVHIYLCRDGLPADEFHSRCTRAFDLLYEKAAQMGGLISGEHGVGYAKRSYFARQHGDTYMSLLRGVKQAFDPQGILNPRKVI